MIKKKLFLISAVISIFFSLYLSLFAADGDLVTADKDFNLLILTMDTLRADRIGVYGHSLAMTPNLDFIAQNGILFKECYSPVPLTLPAHCSLFTGKYPVSHGVRNNGNYALNKMESTLAEIMKDRGYQTYAVIASFVLLSKFGLDQGFDIYDDGLNNDKILKKFDSEIRADRVVEKFNRWLIRRDKNRNFFSWIHFYDPHKPYDPPNDFKKEFPANTAGLYDGEIAFMDYHVGRILESLKSEGLLETTLLILVGDHGEAFGEHQEFGHSLFCYEENLRVPLIFYSPVVFPKARHIKNRVNLIDIMPTVIELFGWKTPKNVQGSSLLEILSGKEEKRPRTYFIESFYGQEEFGWSPLFGIIDGPYKYISLPRPELYNLVEDTKEMNNLFHEENNKAKVLDDLLKKMISTSANTTRESRREMNASDVERLRSLGYVSAFQEKSNSKLDPKEGIILINTLNEIENTLESGNLDIILKNLKDRAEKNPQIKTTQFYDLQLQIYRKKGDLEAIISSLEDEIRRNPDNDYMKINLAFEYFKQEGLDEAEELCMLILKTNNHFTPAHILMAKIKEKRGTDLQALRFFESALKLEPMNVSLKLEYARLLEKNRLLRETEATCRELLEYDSVKDDMMSLAKIGILLAKINKDEMSMEILNRVVSAGKAHAEAWNFLGILHLRRGNFQKSLESFTRSLEEDPSQATTYNNLGTLYLTHFIQTKEGQFNTQALSFFNKALEIDPELASALNGRGSAYKFVNRIQEALKDWKKAIEVKSDYFDVYFNLAVTYIQLEKKQDALKFLSHLKEKYYTQLVSQDQERLERLLSVVKNRKQN